MNYKVTQAIRFKIDKLVLEDERLFSKDFSERRRLFLQAMFKLLTVFHEKNHKGFSVELYLCE